MFVLKPRLRRITYVTAFEVIAIALSTVLLTILSGMPATDSLPIAIAVSAIAVIWNYVFNMMFELWERKAQILHRSLKVRLFHAGGFELGLFLFTVPLYMAWYRVGFVDAFLMEIAVLIFFLIYTFVFTYAFDMLFVLPQHQGERERLA
ncbi:MAG: PACE efflux transporter [Alphaproteobacteria bacterium]|nr:PACE efflux transporter [Alphaproteobacteria bacterium]